MTITVEVLNTKKGCFGVPGKYKSGIQGCRRTCADVAQCIHITCQCVYAYEFGPLSDSCPPSVSKDTLFRWRSDTAGPSIDAEDFPTWKYTPDELAICKQLMCRASSKDMDCPNFDGDEIDDDIFTALDDDDFEAVGADDTQTPESSSIAPTSVSIPTKSVPHVHSPAEKSALKPAPVISTKAPSETEAYTFFVPEHPGFQEKLKRATDAEIVTLMEKLSSEMVLLEDAKLTTEQIILRRKYCVLSIELNNRGKFAPRFRITPRANKINNLTDLEKLLSKDRQVVDLHWLHCNGLRKKVMQHGYENLLMEPEFDFKLASRFAAEEKKLSTKSGWLKLTDDWIWQLSAIQPETIRRKYHVIQYGDRDKQIGHADIILALENSVLSEPHRRPNVPDWGMIWQCDRMIGSDSPKQLAKLHALATGRDKPLDPSDIKRRLKNIKERIATSR